MCVQVVDGNNFILDDDAYVNQPQQDITSLTSDHLDIFSEYF